MKKTKLNKPSYILYYLKQNLKKRKYILGRDLIRALQFDLGIKLDAIELRDYIKQLRLKKVPVIANKLGYKLALNKDELQKYKVARIKEIRAELLALNSMEVK